VEFVLRLFLTTLACYYNCIEKAVLAHPSREQDTSLVFFCP